MIIMHSCDITEHGEFHAFLPSLPRYLEQAGISRARIGCPRGNDVEQVGSRTGQPVDNVLRLWTFLSSDRQLHAALYPH